MKNLLLVLLGIALVAFGALISGTILWLIWPVAIRGAFPALVEQDVLAGELRWWVAVCLVWAFSILFKSSSTSSKND